MRIRPKNVVTYIESRFNTFTTTEKIVAKFFIQNKSEQDFSARTIAHTLHVSEATLSRFAKKLGYEGYREFIFEYVKALAPQEANVECDDMRHQLLRDYYDLMNKTFSLYDDLQMQKAIEKMRQARVIYIYGIGNSGIAAQEFQLRLMRVGFIVNAFTEAHMMKFNAAIVDEKATVLAISMSGETEEVVAAAKLAQSNGAHVICVTSNAESTLHALADATLFIAVKQNMEMGQNISPQLPILLVMDLLYSHLMMNDYANMMSKQNETLRAIESDERRGSK
ncbi:MAG: MurR/RpiR family transcriptional regulator [Bacilli bacterium]